MCSIRITKEIEKRGQKLMITTFTRTSSIPPPTEMRQSSVVSTRLTGDKTSKFTRKMTQSPEKAVEKLTTMPDFLLRVKESAKCRTHRNGKPRKKKTPRPARRRKSGEAKGRPSHIGRAGLKDDPLQHFTGNTRNTQKSGATRVNNCPLPRGASLSTSFPTPFLRSLMLRTCERASSAGTMNAPSSSPSGKRILSWSANTFHNGANCFPISRSSSDLDRRTEIVVSALQKGLSTS